MDVELIDKCDDEDKKRHCQMFVKFRVLRFRSYLVKGDKAFFIEGKIILFFCIKV